MLYGDDFKPIKEPAPQTVLDAYEAAMMRRMFEQRVLSAALLDALTVKLRYYHAHARSMAFPREVTNAASVGDARSLQDLLEWMLTHPDDPGSVMRWSMLDRTGQRRPSRVKPAIGYTVRRVFALRPGERDALVRDAVLAMLQEKGRN